MLMTAEETVLNILSAQSDVPASDIKPTDNLITDLGLDSLDLVEMIMLAEDELCVEIVDEEAEKIATVADAIAMAKRLTAKG